MLHISWVRHFTAQVCLHMLSRRFFTSFVNRALYALSWRWLRPKYPFVRVYLPDRFLCMTKGRLACFYYFYKLFQCVIRYGTSAISPLVCLFSNFRFSDLCLLFFSVTFFGGLCKGLKQILAEQTLQKVPTDQLVPHIDRSDMAYAQQAHTL